MPRQVFDDVQELEKWCKEFVKRGQYTVYTTSDNELILEPRKSTRPQRYAYFKSVKVEELAKLFSETYEIPYFKVERYEWDLDKGIGIRTTIR